MLSSARDIAWLLHAPLALLALAFALARRRDPASTLAWVLGIIFLPLVGPLAYFALANPYVGRPRDRRRDAARRMREENPLHSDIVTDELHPVARSVIEGCRRLTGLPATGGNRVELYSDTGQAENARLAALEAAREQIWAEYYIVHGDAAGQRFLAALAERSRAGVDVRLLVDAVGSMDIDHDGVASLRAAGGHVEVFHPVNPLRRRWAVHLRNHRKILVVDGTTAFCGGMNIGDNYAGRRRRKPPPFRDTMLRIEGPAAVDLARVFAEDWCFMRGETLRLRESTERPGATAVAILPSGPDQAHNATALAWFSAVSLSLERCWLTTPYFVPDPGMLRALSTAARRGVDVRVVLPRYSDFWLMDLVNRSYYLSLLECGARVFEYAPAMMHAKTLVVDRRLALVGSANVDMRSFDLNFEVGALVADETFAATVEAAIEADIARSREVTLDEVRRAPLAAALAQGAAKLLSPVL